MARISDHNITPILDAAEQWKDTCFAKTGSVFGDEPIWTGTLLGEFEQNFINNPDFGEDNFFTKLEKQVKAGSSQLAKLVAEILWLYYLFPSNVTHKTKVEQICEVFGWSGEQLDPKHPMLEALQSGVGSAGMGYNLRRPDEIEYLFKIVSAFRELDTDQQNELLQKPWDFSNWLDATSDSIDDPNRTFRHILVFLLFPDEMERIASKNHKVKIEKHWKDSGEDAPIADKDSELVALDKRLLAIRKQLEASSENKPLDFYFEPWKGEWLEKKSAKPTNNQVNEDPNSYDSAPQLAAPFDTCFESIEEANALLDLAALGLNKLGLGAESENDPRMAITLPRGVTARTGTLRFNFGSWIAFSFIKQKDGERVFQFSCLKDRLPDYQIPDKDLPKYDSQAISSKDSNPNIKHDLIEVTVSDALTPEFVTLFCDSMKAFGEVFKDWKGTPYKIHHHSEIYGLFFDKNQRNELLKNGLIEEPPVIAPDVLKPYSINELNEILYGPPGTGKTYSTVRKAVSLIDGEVDEANANPRFQELKREGRIEFLTFHQSYSYEDFVEGIRPDMSDDSEAQFALKDGVFKQMATKATYSCLEAINEIQPGAPGFAQLWDELIQRIADGSIDELKIKTEQGTERSFTPSLSPRNSIVISERQYTCSRKIASKLYASMKTQDAINLKDASDILGNPAPYPLVGAVFNALKDLEHNWASDLPLENSSMEFSAVSDDDMHSTVQAYLTMGEASGYRLKPQNQCPPYVLIIDEINRGNISKILGELITLLEPDKRLGADNELSVQLPYSRETFTVPGNLHLIGTMNTADKSIALVDVALRRRFQFQELNPDFSICQKLPDDLRSVMEEINKRIMLRKDRDHRIGHAYFMQVDSPESFDEVMRLKIIPLIAEYFYNDWEGLREVLGENDKDTGLIRPIEGTTGRGRNRWQWDIDAGEKVSPSEVLLKNLKLAPTDAE